MSRPRRPVRRPLAHRALVALLLAVAATGCATPRAAARPAAESTIGGVPILARAAWGARAPVLPMREHVPDRITIHHTGTAQNLARGVADKLRALQAFSQRDDSLASGQRKPAWPDVPYHYYVGVDGAVGEGRPWRYVGDSNTPYDPTGHLLVVVEGSFDREALTAAQRRTLDALIPALARRFGVRGERLGMHKDFAQTSCPGKAVEDEMPRWRAMLDAVR